MIPNGTSWHKSTGSPNFGLPPENLFTTAVRNLELNCAALLQLRYVRHAYCPDVFYQVQRSLPQMQVNRTFVLQLNQRPACAIVKLLWIKSFIIKQILFQDFNILRELFSLTGLYQRLLYWF